MAQQANGSVLLRYGDNVFLAAATMGTPRDGIDFFPLTIDVEERLYARGLDWNESATPKAVGTAPKHSLR